MLDLAAVRVDSPNTHGQRVERNAAVVTRAITSIRRLKETLPQGYSAVVTLVPASLDAQHPLREEHDDRAIDVDVTMGSVWIHVVNPADNAFVATAVFGADARAVRCDTIEVMPIYRLKGVATALYKIASRSFAAPVVPSGNLSNDAKRFWGTNTRIRWHWWDAVAAWVRAIGRWRG